MKNLNFEELKTLNNVNKLKTLISFCEEIPKDKWISGAYELNGSHCFLGHCGMRNGVSSSEKEREIFNHIRSLTASLLHMISFDNNLAFFNSNWINKEAFNDMINNKSGTPIISINDGSIKEYPQDNPKDRVLAALNDLLNIEILLEEFNELKNRELVLVEN